MESSLVYIINSVYDVLNLQVSELKQEEESKEYQACSFKLNDLKIISRASKVTPKKIGQFVTFWKRNENGPIEPFHKNDSLDFYVVNVSCQDRLGQFVFPKSVLIEKGIISTVQKEGKRAFRVYPVWDVVKSRQAERTQKWQLNYFYEINSSMNFKKIAALYANY